MGLEIVFFAGAFVLLVALIYGTLHNRYRDRAAVRAAEEITRERYRHDDPHDHYDDHYAEGPPATAVPPKTREPNGVEPDFTEDDIQRAQLGPRGVPGAPDPAKMTPQRDKKTPSTIDQGHVS